MKGLLKFLQLSFLPKNVDLGLLVLRVALGAQMIYGHGWGKLMTFSELAPKFGDPFGLGTKTSLALAVFAEVVCSALIALGLFTRFAAVFAIVTMATAFFLVHKGQLTGQGSGEMAFLYLIGFIAIFLSGPGKYSVDAQISSGA
jgi:putative oxidoreductase